MQYLPELPVSNFPIYIGRQCEKKLTFKDITGALVNHTGYVITVSFRELLSDGSGLSDVEAFTCTAGNGRLIRDDLYGETTIILETALTDALDAYDNKLLIGDVKRVQPDGTALEPWCLIYSNVRRLP